MMEEVDYKYISGRRQFHTYRQLCISVCYITVSICKRYPLGMLRHVNINDVNNHYILSIFTVVQVLFSKSEPTSLCEIVFTV